MPTVKWLVVLVILGYLGLRVYVTLRPTSTLGRAFRRRYLLRTDAQAMTRTELALSAMSFLLFAVVAVGLDLGIVWGTNHLAWGILESRPVVALAKAGLFVGALALAASLFLLGAAVLRRS
jgi:hypothetical protein